MDPRRCSLPFPVDFEAHGFHKRVEVQTRADPFIHLYQNVIDHNGDFSAEKLNVCLWVGEAKAIFAVCSSVNFAEFASILPAGKHR